VTSHRNPATYGDPTVVAARARPPARRPNLRVVA
jgi:hypothetical protein